MMIPPLSTSRRTGCAQCGEAWESCCSTASFSVSLSVCKCQETSGSLVVGEHGDIIFLGAAPRTYITGIHLLIGDIFNFVLWMF